MSVGVFAHGSKIVRLYYAALYGGAVVANSVQSALMSDDQLAVELYGS